MSGSNYQPPYFPSAAENGIYRGLLHECAEVLREDIEGCANCNYGEGSTGVHPDGTACEGCADFRDLLRRIEAVI